MGNKPLADLPVLTFASAQKLEDWFAENHATTNGIWLQFAKKASGIATVTQDEAIQAALCYGWIDGQGKPFDEKYWLVKYTPRRPGSVWSKRNQEFVKALGKAGKMQSAGLQEVERAKADGRWARAYDSPANMKVPEDFLKELAKDKAAETFYLTLNKANTYAIAWRLHTAKKAETRARRMEKFLDMMKKGEKLH